MGARVAEERGGGGREGGRVAAVSPLSATRGSQWYCPRPNAPRILNGREFAVTSRAENEVRSVRRFGI